MRSRLWLLASVAALSTACAAHIPNVGRREYHNLGRLHEVLLYEDSRAVAEECYRRTGGVGDDGRAFSPGGSNACTDEAGGTIRIDERASLRDFLHELCHVEHPGFRAYCDRSYPGGR